MRWHANTHFGLGLCISVILRYVLKCALDVPAQTLASHVLLMLFLCFASLLDRQIWLKTDVTTFRSVLHSGCLELLSYVCQKCREMWAVYWRSRLLMRDILLDKVMYVVFLPPQPAAPLHKAVLRGCSADLMATARDCSAFMSLRTASIYQASAGSFDLWQHVIWSCLSEVDFGFIVANMACVNLGFYFFCRFSLAPAQSIGVPSLVQKWVEKFDLQCKHQLQTKGII